METSRSTLRNLTSRRKNTAEPGRRKSRRLLVRSEKDIASEERATDLPSLGRDTAQNVETNRCFLRDLCCDDLQQSTFGFNTCGRRDGRTDTGSTPRAACLVCPNVGRDVADLQVCRRITTIVIDLKIRVLESHPCPSQRRDGCREGQSQTARGFPSAHAELVVRGVRRAVRTRY